MLFQTAVSYQLSLNFHNTSKFVALTKKKKKAKKIRQRCHARVTLTLFAIIMVHNGQRLKTLETELENDVIDKDNLVMADMDRLRPYVCQL